MLREIAKDIPEGLELGLRNYWYPLMESAALGRDAPVAIEALGERLAAWRDENGRPQLVHDRCPHRMATLSDGRVLAGNIQCRFHGLRFDGTGRCTLIPWEPDDSPLRSKVSVAGYPAEDLGGYVWAYLGDTAAFPPPPLRDEAPEELLDDARFLNFRLPIETWNGNWLLVIDGAADSFHAASLHAESQGVSNDRWKGGGAAHSDVPLKDRRVKLVDTPQGLRGVPVDRAGNPIHTGHFLRIVTMPLMILPGIATNPIRPAPGAVPYVSRLWTYPIDGKRTRIVRYASFRVSSDESRRAAKKVYDDLVLPRLQKISAEDAAVSASQGDLIDARSKEYLFRPDVDVVKMRRQLKEAFTAQHERKRVAVPKVELGYPLDEDQSVADTVTS